MVETKAYLPHSIPYTDTDTWRTNAFMDNTVWKQECILQKMDFKKLEGDHQVLQAYLYSGSFFQNGNEHHFHAELYGTAIHTGVGATLVKESNILATPGVHWKGTLYKMFFFFWAKTSWLNSNKFSSNWH